MRIRRQEKSEQVCVQYQSPALTGMKNDDLEMAREESGPWTKVIMAKSDGACLNSV